MGDEPNATATAPEPFRDVIRIDEGQLHKHLDQVVRDSVEQTLNASTSPTSRGGVPGR